MYKTANMYYREKFGSKVYKLSLDAGFTCPNRDGKIDRRGCIFCTGSGEFAKSCKSDIVKALEDAKKIVEKKNKSGKYIAYLQSYTNTYDKVENLRKIYYDAISPDYIVGLNIATRPDCISDETLDLLSEINFIKPVAVELGLQTSNEDTADYIRRGYKNSVYSDAVKRLRSKSIEVITHIIIGLPNETEQDAINTTEFAVKSGTNGIKFHMLHVMKNTDLAYEYEKGTFKCLKLEDYARILKHCIDILPNDIVVHRITGDGAKSGLIAPLWSADKKRVINYLNKYLND
ncbi:MAG: TIGR01212 family radical SAM protein [Clostridia bacterium]|nr:TIGR01212 family radical SAM protein [Clostridia bacterium]